MLNDFQINQLEATFFGEYGALSILAQDSAIPANVRLSAFRCLLALCKNTKDQTFYKSKLSEFIEHHVIEVVDCVKKILEHPCPQNRSQDYPYFQRPIDRNLVVYKNDLGVAATEQRGILNLSSKIIKIIVIILLIKLTLSVFSRKVLNSELSFLKETLKLKHSKNNLLL